MTIKPFLVHRLLWKTHLSFVAFTALVADSVSIVFAAPEVSSDQAISPPCLFGYLR